MEKYKTIAIIAGILGVTVLEAIALIKGINGQFFSIAVGAITFLVGMLFGEKIFNKK